MWIKTSTTATRESTDNKKDFHYYSPLTLKYNWGNFMKLFFFKYGIYFYTMFFVCVFLHCMFSFSPSLSVPVSLWCVCFCVCACKKWTRGKGCLCKPLVSAFIRILFILAWGLFHTAVNHISQDQVYLSACVIDWKVKVLPKTVWPPTLLFDFTYNYQSQN